MICRQETRRRHPAQDEGFSLAEALVGLVIFGTTIAAAMPLVLGGLVTQQELQARQNAVSLASAALAKLEALPTEPPVGDCVPLLAGRYFLPPDNASDITITVISQFQDAPETIRSSMSPVANPESCSYIGSVPSNDNDELVHVSEQKISELSQLMDYHETVDDVDMRIRTFVGECTLAEQAIGLQEADCLHPTAVNTTRPNRDMYRLVVLAEWHGDECANQLCSIELSTLKHRGKNVVFRDLSSIGLTSGNWTESGIIHGRRDEFTAQYKVPTNINLLANDDNVARVKEVEIFPSLGPGQGSIEGDAMEGTLTYRYAEPVSWLTPQHIARVGFQYWLITFDGERVGPTEVWIDVVKEL